MVNGGNQDPTGGRQPQLAELLLALPRAESLDLSVIRGLARQAKKHGQDWTRLADLLEDITRIESLVAPAANAFELVLARQGLEIAEVATDLRKQWGMRLRHVPVDELEALRAEILVALQDAASVDRWLAVAQELAEGQYESVLRLLVEQNEAVMRSRQGSPWVRLTGRRLEVRYRDESAALVDGRTLPNLLRHPYFIDSLWRVAAEVDEARTRGHP